MAKSNKIVYMGTGRRKSSIARVRLVEGTGKITKNQDKPGFFPGKDEKTWVFTKNWWPGASSPRSPTRR